MNVELKIFLDSIEADDYFTANIRNKNGTIYYGWAHELPEKLYKLKVVSIYLDFGSEAIGITVE